jgi:N-acetylneuraminic acid mutarotase
LKKSILVIALIVILNLVAAPSLMPIISATTESAWTTKTPMPKAAVHFKAEAVNNKIYVFGPNVTYQYDLSSWLTKQPMPSYRSSFATTTYQNRIYCIGGRTNIGPSAANEVYIPASDSWESKQAMSTPRHGLDANVVNDKIYLISGLVPDNRWPNVNVESYKSFIMTNATEEYDPSTDTWVTKAPIPKAAAYYSSAVIDNKIYIFSLDYFKQKDGNYESLTQIYDPNTDTWTNGNPPPYAVDMAGSTAITNSDFKRIYVIGGRSSSLQVAYNQIYNPATDSWSLGAPLPTPRYALAVCSLNKKIYTFGGYQGAFGTVSLRANNEQYDPSKDITSPIITSPTPPPTQLPTINPSPEPPQTEPLQTILVIGSVIVVAAVSIGLLVYLKKRQGNKRS